LNDWDNVMKAAKDKVWPDIRKQVGASFFDAAMKHSLLNKK